MNTTVNNTPGAKQPKTDSVVCDLCGANDYQVLFEGRDRLHQRPGTFPVVQCRQCQLVYLNPRPAEDTLADYYPEDYSPFKQERGITQRVQSWLRLRQARRIQKTIPLRGRVLEVGCATGDLLVPLRDMGVSVAGIEISQHAAEIARRDHNLEVHTGTLFDAPYAPNSFDAVVMRHVIEHFPSACRALKQIARLLKQEGLLFITTPNYDSLDRVMFGEFWHNYEIPRHQLVFSVDTLTGLLQKTGFKLLHVQHSLLPNDWVHSLHYIIAEHFDIALVAKVFSIKNPLILLVFLPFGILQRLLKKSGRIDVLALKRS